jgi:hypothetical protein
MKTSIVTVAIVMTAVVGCRGVANQASLTEDISVFRWSDDSKLQSASSLTPVVAGLGNGAKMVFRGACDFCGDHLRSETYSSGRWQSDFQFIDATSTSKPAFAAFNGYYYMFYASHQSQYMARFDPNHAGWSNSTLLPFLSMDAPAIAAFNGKLYIVRQDPPNGQLFWLTMDTNETFSAEQPLTQSFFGGGCRNIVIGPGAPPPIAPASEKAGLIVRRTPEFATATPGLTVYNNCLYLAHRDVATGSLVYNTFQSNWGAAQVIPDGPGGPPQTSALEPAIAAYGGALHLVHVSDSGAYGDSIYWSTFDPTNGWSPAITIPNRETHGTPSLAALTDRVLMVHLGSKNGDTSLWTATFQ